MGKAIEQFKLCRGMGRLKRYSRNGGWTWERWDRRQRKWVGAATSHRNRSKAEQWVYQQVASRDDLDGRHSEIALLFSTVADEYYAARELGRDLAPLRPASLKRLRTARVAFKRFVGRGFGTLLINHVDAVMLREFVTHEAARPISTITANMHLDSIAQIVKFAADRRYVSQMPEVKHVRQPTANVAHDGVKGSPVPTTAQVRQIIEAARPKIRSTGQIRADGRRIFTGLNQNDYSDLFSFLCSTGLRIGEAIHLTWADVDADSNVIHIRPGMKNGEYWQPKTRSSIRKVPITDDIQVILTRLRRSNRRNRWVFETSRGTQVYAHNVEKRFRQICDQLGFQQHFVPHSLRKYWASMVAQQGMDWNVMIKLFGHTDYKLILTTYYGQNDVDRIIAEASKIDFGLAT